MGRVGAAVVTFRRPAGLRRTIDALLAQDSVLDDVIVVDNGGDARIDDARVMTIDAGGNTGAAGGFALALDEAARRGIDWLYLLNDDDCPRLGAVSALLRRANSDFDPSSVAAVGAWITADGKLRAAGAAWHRGVRPVTLREVDKLELEVDVATFCGLLVNVERAVRAGGVRADLFMMWEEFDLCLRMRRHGGRIVMLTEPLVDIDPNESARYPPWRGYYGARNGLLVIRSLGEWRALPWFLTREAKAMIAAARLPEGRVRVTMRLRGLIHGVLGRVGRTVTP